MEASWPHLMHDLRQVQVVTVGLEGRCFRICSDLSPAAAQAFEAIGLRPPSPHGGAVVPQIEVQIYFCRFSNSLQKGAV